MSGGEIEYIISVGSNLTNGADLVADGLRFLESIMKDCRKSKIYSTPSVSFNDDSIYFNAVIGGVSSICLSDMQLRCKGWEKSVGRNGYSSSHEVAGDMDIVMVNGEVVRPKDFGRDYFKIGFNQMSRGETKPFPED